MPRTTTPARLAAVTALAAGTALLAAGCGSSGSGSGVTTPLATKTVTQTASSSPSVTTSPSTAASASPSDTAPPACATSNLHLSVGQTEGTAGSVVYPVQLTNTGQTSCTLYGYPGVSFVTAASGGTVIGQAATRNPARSEILITVAPGNTASALLQVAEAGNYPAARCHQVTAHYLQVYPPNQTAPLTMSFTSPTCSSKKVKVLSVETMQSGKTGN